MKKLIVLIGLLGFSLAGPVVERIYVTPIANGKWASANFTIIGTGNILASANNSAGINIKTGVGNMTVTGSATITGTLTANNLVAGHGGIETSGPVTISGKLEVAGTISANDIANTAWTSWTPTAYATGGTAPTFSYVQAYYKVVGKTVNYQFSMQSPGGGGAGAAQIMVSTPTSVNANNPVAGNGSAYNNTTSTPIYTTAVSDRFKMYKANGAGLTADDLNNATHMINLCGQYEKP